MRLYAVGFLLAAGLFGAADEIPPTAKDSEKLQGKWVATALRHGDTETPKEEIDKGEVTLVVKKDNTFTFRTPKETHEGTIRLGTLQSPRTMDLLITTKEGKKKTILCIYDWEGQKLRIAGDERKRPTNFKSKLGGSIVVTLKRAED